MGVPVRKLGNFVPADVELELVLAAGATPYSYAEEQLELGQAAVIELDAKKILCETVVYEESCTEKKFSGERKFTLDDVRSGTASLEELVSQLSVQGIHSVGVILSIILRIR